MHIGEVLPPTLDGLLKFCVDVSFMNTSLHAKSGQMISAPPDQLDQAQHDIPQSLKDECFRVVKGIYGKELEDVHFDSFRICWYNPSISSFHSSSDFPQGRFHSQPGLYHFPSSTLPKPLHRHGWVIPRMEVSASHWRVCRAVVGRNT